jgi:hypothetical protein
VVVRYRQHPLDPRLHDGGGPVGDRFDPGHVRSA